MVLNKVEDADRKAAEADCTAQNASALSMQNQTHLHRFESGFDKRIGNVDNYQPVRKVTINFRINQYKLDKRSEEALDALAAELKVSKGYLLEIQGYADPSGPLAVNLELSRQRAESVVAYLTEKHEIPLYRMRDMGMGITPKKLAIEEGLKSSRRVEIQLLHNESIDVAAK
jgi:outer membrane protein OmpA-like peptidoglycan-associated protein